MLERINNAGPCATACKPRAGTGAATIVSTAENIFARTLEHEPPNDAHLHGRVRRCRVCRAEALLGKSALDDCCEVEVRDIGTTVEYERPEGSE